MQLHSLNFIKNKHNYFQQIKDFENDSIRNLYFNGLKRWDDNNNYNLQFFTKDIALNKSYDIEEKLEEIIKDYPIKNEYGIMVYKVAGTESYYFYNVNQNYFYLYAFLDSWLVSFSWFDFRNLYHNAINNNVFFDIYKKSNEKYYNKDHINPEDHIKPFTFLRNAVNLYFFKKIVQVETKIVNNEHKHHKIGNDKFINTSNIDIEIIDSKWFTNIIRNEQFGVRGHFRLQRCGESFNKIKLIWIKDFIKHGYHKKAGKLA